MGELASIPELESNTPKEKFSFCNIKSERHSAVAVDFRDFHDPTRLNLRAGCDTVLSCGRRCHHEG